MCGCFFSNQIGFPLNLWSVHVFSSLQKNISSVLLNFNLIMKLKVHPTDHINMEHFHTATKKGTKKLLSYRAFLRKNKQIVIGTFLYTNLFYPLKYFFKNLDNNFIRKCESLF